MPGSRLRTTATRLVRGLSAAPGWVRATAGLAVAALGVLVLLRPTTTLDVLAVLVGLGLLALATLELAPPRHGAPALRWLRCTAWCVAGVVVLLAPGLTVSLLATLVGATLLLNGVSSVLDGLRSAPADERVAEVAYGLTGATFGVLALIWPDVTLLVACVALGARLVMAGLRLAWSPTSRAAEPPRRWRRTLPALLSLAVAVAAAGTSMAVRERSPVVDDFYAAPRTVPDEPGRLVRAEPFTRGVPDSGRAWRILYTTTDGTGSPGVASGIVVVPRRGDGGWPVVDWAHGTTGVAQQCAPSLAREPFESGAMFLLPQVLEEGWALVAADYPGLGAGEHHPYLVGSDTARSVLDATRAARELGDADLGDEHVVWGHSQGGGAALWASAEAPSYAPDVDVRGVAAMAPASDLPAMVTSLGDVTGGSVLEAYVFAGFSARYPEISYRSHVRPGAERTVRAFASRCLAEPGVLVSVLQALALGRDQELLSQDPSTGALVRRLQENVPAPDPGTPLLLAQGLDDTLVEPGMQRAYASRLCAAGVVVDERRYRGLDHVPLVEAESPLAGDLIAWTRARFAHEQTSSACQVRTR